MASQDAKIQEEVVADNKEGRTTTILGLEKVADFMSQRIDKLKVELQKRMAANREMDAKLILLDFMAGRHTSVADLPADVLRDLGSLVDDCINAVAEEAYEPPVVVPEAVVAASLVTELN